MTGNGPPDFKPPDLCRVGVVKATAAQGFTGRFLGSSRRQLSREMQSVPGKPDSPNETIDRNGGDVARRQKITTYGSAVVEDVGDVRQIQDNHAVRTASAMLIAKGQGFAGSSEPV